MEISGEYFSQKFIFLNFIESFTGKFFSQQSIKVLGASLNKISIGLER